MFQIGSSSEILGVYKIIAALQRLMLWAICDYKPWFESYMVPLTPEEKLAFGV